jgi:hypothetical protein
LQESSFFQINYIGKFYPILLEESLFLISELDLGSSNVPSLMESNNFPNYLYI